MNKQDKKALRRQYKRQETEKLEQSLPLPRELFAQLFDYLDESFGEQDCRHDFTLTARFLRDCGCDPDPVFSWLLDNGAGCDCEVLGNIEELLEE